MVNAFLAALALVPVPLHVRETGGMSTATNIVCEIDGTIAEGIRPAAICSGEKRGRTDRVLRSGWTVDGQPVEIPHCWNVDDACDGKGVPEGWEGSSSVDCPSYERKSATYRCALPSPTAGRRQFVRFEGASVKATVRVNGQTLGVHKGAFTAFAFEVTAVLKPSGNVMEVVVDNSIDRDIPPWGGDFVIYGGLYRDVHFIETDPVCIDSLTDGADNIVVDADPKTGEVTPLPLPPRAKEPHKITVVEWTWGGEERVRN